MKLNKLLVVFLICVLALDLVVARGCYKPRGRTITTIRRITRVMPKVVRIVKTVKNIKRFRKLNRIRKIQKIRRIIKGKPVCRCTQRVLRRIVRRG
uniref:Uncharacterized protein n=1 Tax=Pandinus cavimanus TaxID=217261 RepID=H2CYN1_PANCV|nr:hypothetical protein [Pandinus cavimanus]